ncbi:MAG: endonuclease domain-containing protein [Candidatus Shapirobacteria bacterium]|nr:endonuclease domain-containing protein [Candidatus Shapirobacteria bacterium]
MKKDIVIEAKTQKYHLRYRDSLTWAARNNRKKETEAEKLIWNQLLRRKNLGVKFVKQKPIDRFILDFYCSNLCLAIEIDGGSHKVKSGRDNLRDKYLKACGITTLRFTNKEVINNIKEVARIIRKYISDSLALSRERVRDRV